MKTSRSKKSPQKKRVDLFSEIPHHQKLKRKIHVVTELRGFVLNKDLGMVSRTVGGIQEDDVISSEFSYNGIVDILCSVIALWGDRDVERAYQLLSKIYIGKLSNTFPTFTYELPAVLTVTKELFKRTRTVMEDIIFICYASKIDNVHLKKKYAFAVLENFTDKKHTPETHKLLYAMVTSFEPRFFTCHVLTDTKFVDCWKRVLDEYPNNEHRRIFLDILDNDFNKSMDDEQFQYRVYALINNLQSTTDKILSCLENLIDKDLTSRRLNLVIFNYIRLACTEYGKLTESVCEKIRIYDERISNNFNDYINILLAEYIYEKENEKYKQRYSVYRCLYTRRNSLYTRVLNERHYVDVDFTFLFQFEPSLDRAFFLETSALYPISNRLSVPISCVKGKCLAESMSNLSGLDVSYGLPEYNTQALRLKKDVFNNKVELSNVYMKHLFCGFNFLNTIQRIEVHKPRVLSTFSTCVLSMQSNKDFDEYVSDRGGFCYGSELASFKYRIIYDIYDLSKPLKALGFGLNSGYNGPGCIFVNKDIYDALTGGRLFYCVKDHDVQTLIDDNAIKNLFKILKVDIAKAIDEYQLKLSLFSTTYVLLYVLYYGIDQYIYDWINVHNVNHIHLIVMSYLSNFLPLCDIVTLIYEGHNHRYKNQSVINLVFVGWFKWPNRGNVVVISD